MLSRILAAFCFGFDAPHTTLIMPREIPTIDPNKTDPTTLIGFFSPEHHMIANP